MIAHRLSTIANADNLLYFESNSKLTSARRNTQEYYDIMDKLTVISIAHGEMMSSEESDDEIQLYSAHSF